MAKYADGQVQTGEMNARVVLRRGVLKVCKATATQASLSSSSSSSSWSSSSSIAPYVCSITSRSCAAQFGLDSH